MPSQTGKKFNSPPSSFPGPLDHTHVANLAVMNVEFQYGAHLVKSRNAGRSRVEVESAPRRDFLDKQNVTVTTNKKIGRVCLQFRENAFGKFDTTQGTLNKVKQFPFKKEDLKELPLPFRELDDILSERKGGYSIDDIFQEGSGFEHGPLASAKLHLLYLLIS